VARQIGDRGARERPAQRFLPLEEHEMHVAAAVLAAGAAAQHARDASRVALDRLDHLEQRQARRVAGELVAAGASRGCLDQACAQEVGEDLRQESDGDVHRVGDAS
jgi:hypothetical protein